MPVHYRDAAIIIHKIVCGPYSNNAYVLVDPASNESIVIDAPEEPGPLIEEARETSVKAVLITHNHSDHIRGLAEVTAALGVPVGIGKADAHALSRQPDFFLEEGTRVDAGGIALRAIPTPGHTPGSTCLLFRRHLFAGDTLFPGGPGRTSSAENLRQLLRSITTRLLVLEDEVAFYPGHGDDGTLKAAREEYAAFASRQHPPDLHGDVTWLHS